MVVDVGKQKERIARIIRSMTGIQFSQRTFDAFVKIFI